MRTIEVEIDEAGEVHPIQPGDKLPPGRATLTWRSQDERLALHLAEPALAEDWLRPEEDEAWAPWQQAK